MTRCIPLNVSFEMNGQEQTIWPVIIQGESDVILVDCGYPDFVHLLEEAALRQNIRLESITKLILTHDDIDHIGSAAVLKRKYPHIEIIASEGESPYIDGSKKSLRLIQAESTLHHLTGEDLENAKQFVRFLKSAESVQVDQVLQRELSLPWCGGIEVVHTPGHTPCHISLYLPFTQTMLAADAVVIENGKLNIANPEYCLDLSEAIRSVQKLQQFEISQLICYHGGIFEGKVNEALQLLIDDYT